ncbi:hypothetical protein ES702_05965 [subsurface metagenome]
MGGEQKPTNNKPKRSFVLVWRDELDYFKTLNSTDLKVYLIYRISADTRNNLSPLQYSEIKKISGLSQPTLARSRKRLIARGLILPCGYKLTAVYKFDIKNDTKSKTFDIKNDTKNHNLVSKMIPNKHKIDNDRYSVINKHTLFFLRDKRGDFYIKEFYKAQNQDFEHYKNWAFKIIQERLANGFNPGEILALIKRHTGQTIMIHIALSIENLNSLRAKMRALVDDKEFDKKLEFLKKQPRFKGTKIAA